jgi:hypothetical protein
VEFVSQLAENMAVTEVFTGFLAKLKTDKGFLVRIIIGSILFITTLGLGFGLLVRTWVYQKHLTKFALEAVGFSDPNFTETFPQVSCKVLSLTF